MRLGGTHMPGLLQNHIAAVTGAGSGIGQASAIGYAREGASLAVLDINSEAARETARTITDAGGKATAFALDVTDRVACSAAAAEDESTVGRISVLVNNAGFVWCFGMTGEPDAVEKDWLFFLAINFF